MRLVLATAGIVLAASAWAQTPLVEVPFAGYGDGRVRHGCTTQSILSGWATECHFTGAITGDDFTLPLDHAFRISGTGCFLALPGASAVPIACRRFGQQFGSWIEVSEILGTPCRAVGTVWSHVAATTEGESDPPIYVVKVELELLIEAGQATCEPGTWEETRYYLVCAERPEPGPFTVSVNERVCDTGVEFLTYEAVHRKPGNEDDPWYRRLFAQVRSAK